jgi:ATP-dependent DNA helicase PIF1
MQLSQEQENALQLMLSGKNVFLTGEAGTGKSTILREFRARNGSCAVFLAPTGIAAINVKGSTLHSFFLFKPGLLTPETIGDVGTGKRRQMIRQTKIIIIDEISMVRSDVFCAIDYRLRQLALGKNNKERPFGGKQMIVVGDFFQLPPVVKTGMEESYLNDTLGGMYAFQTTVWQRAGFKTVLLKTIHRQKGETTFVNILNDIRHNNLDERNIVLQNGETATALDALNSCCTGKSIVQPPPIILCTTNKEAESYNVLCQNHLTAKQQIFKAVVVGKFNEKDYPTQAILSLQEGARVMILVNKRNPNGEFEYVNGDTGMVVATNGSTTIVTVKLDSGRTCDISPNTWIQYEYVLETDNMTGEKSIRQKETGKFTQMPLKSAYAITIHKSQGMSLDRVYVKLGNGCFAHGQLYTALSRCRSLQTLQLERRLFAEDVIVDQAVVNFYYTFERPQDTKSHVSLTIPKEYEEAMRAYLAKLQGKDAPSSIMPHKFSAKPEQEPKKETSEAEDAKSQTSSPSRSEVAKTVQQSTTFSLSEGRANSFGMPSVEKVGCNPTFSLSEGRANSFGMPSVEKVGCNPTFSLSEGRANSFGMPSVEKVGQSPTICLGHPDIEHLIIVYRNQTSDEHGTAMHKNNKGFNKMDAPILTKLAEKYLKDGFLYEDELQIVSSKIKKYHAQFKENPD